MNNIQTLMSKLIGAQIVAATGPGKLPDWVGIPIPKWNEQQQAQPERGGGEVTVIDEERPAAPPEVQKPPVNEKQDDDKTGKPPMFAVILHNDNTTSMGFVTEVLSTVFKIPGGRAQQIMMSAHRAGAAVVEIYSREVAEQRLAQAQAMITQGDPGGRNPDAPCELTFTIEQETKGE